MTENGMLSDELRILGNLMRRAMDRAMQEQEEILPRTQGMMLCYLYEHRNGPVYQRDIEKNFRIRRSTVTGVLQAMERRGLIRREPVAEDGRLKQICLTEQALRRQEQFFPVVRMLDARMTRGLSREELEGFTAVIKHIRRNLEEEEHD